MNATVITVHRKKYTRFTSPPNPPGATRLLQQVGESKCSHPLLFLVVARQYLILIVVQFTNESRKYYSRGVVHRYLTTFGDSL